jgi:hypothetical protein
LFTAAGKTQEMMAQYSTSAGEAQQILSELVILPGKVIICYPNGLPSSQKFTS